MMGPAAMRFAGLCLLAVCLLDRAVAFIVPSGRGVASLGLAPSALSSSATRQPASLRSRGASALVMQEGSTQERSSAAQASVAVYRKFIGAKRWDAFDDAEAMATVVFEEICNVYGEENAVQMVKNSPSCLGYDSSTFRATFEAFSEVFPPEDTKGMVTRNPNLLAVRPTGFGGACNAKSDTMQMSYVIAFTRPLGPVLLGGTFLLLSIPLIEIVTGIPREQFLSTLIS